LPGRGYDWRAVTVLFLLIFGVAILLGAVGAVVITVVLVVGKLRRGRGA
jgi:hypothetical protein